MASALKRLSTERPTRDDIDKAMDEISSDHPRSAAIVAAALVEDLLQLTLNLRMIELSKDEVDRLFVGDAPLSSFAAKTRIAYAFGLIGAKARHDLDIVREIRNAFAHAKVSFTFDTPAVADTINRLHFKALSQDWTELSNQRKFGVVVRLIMIYLIAGWTESSPDLQTIRNFDIPSTAGQSITEDQAS